MVKVYHLESSIDVATVIDWENRYGCLHGKANIATLREVAGIYERLVLAKACADGREHRFQQVQQ